MTGEPETDQTGRRPLWRKKRWWAAGLLWLAASYPPSVGPADYAAERGWLPAAARDAAYAPMAAIERADRAGRLGHRLHTYRLWFRQLAWKHDPGSGLIVCDFGGPAPGETAEAAAVALGRRLFEQRACVICHEPLPGGRRVGPDLRETYGRDLLLADGTTARGDDAYLRESILDPGAKVRAGFGATMPSYEGHFSERQLAALVAFVASLRTEPAAVEPTAAN